MRTPRKRALRAATAFSAVALLVAACTGDGESTSDGPDGTSPAVDDDGSSGASQPWILGTTDTVTSLDPAGFYDVGSATLAYSLYQTMLTIPAGESEPAGDAAESCEYTDPQTLKCTLREGLKFSNGHDLTSSDVKFTFERNVRIADPDGASGLLASMKSVEAPDDLTVLFHLKRPDTTFQSVITYAAFGIVDEEVFAAGKLLPNEEIVGSGPYSLDEYAHGTSAELVKNENYQGPRAAQAPLVQVQYFDESADLKLAVEQGDVHVAWRNLSPGEISDLSENDAVNIIDGEGSEVRHWVWQLGTEVGAQLPIRQAVAQIIDREAIAERAYAGTVEPLYSPVPPSVAGHVPAFKEVYGEPSTEAAAQILGAAGVETPVDLTLGYTPSHYGPNAVDEATELQRQLEESGPFDITLASAEWEEYRPRYRQGDYDLFMLGWFPDFPDADNYLPPFIAEGGPFANNYRDPTVNDLVAQEQAASDQDERERIFGELQTIIAQDVPLIPSWVGKNIAVTVPGISGIEPSLDPSFIFRIWEITYSGE